MVPLLVDPESALSPKASASDITEAVAALQLGPWICLAVIPLAGMMGHATEELAERMGEGVGGLLNATFGNAAELIIAMFALFRGLDNVVKASLTGSIIGTVAYMKFPPAVRQVSSRLRHVSSVSGGACLFNACPFPTRRGRSVPYPCVRSQR